MLPELMQDEESLGKCGEGASRLGVCPPQFAARTGMEVIQRGCDRCDLDANLGEPAHLNRSDRTARQDRRRWNARELHNGGPGAPQHRSGPNGGGCRPDSGREP